MSRTFDFTNRSKKGKKMFFEPRTDLPPAAPTIDHQSPVLPPVRRFEYGSSEIMIEEALRALGYDRLKRYMGRGKPFGLGTRRLSQRELFELVDGWRVARGLEPIDPRNRKPLK